MKRTATSATEEALRGWLDRVSREPGGVNGVMRRMLGATDYTYDEPAKIILDGEDYEHLEKCPWTAKQLQGKLGLPLAACQRHIDRGTWRTLL